MTFRVLSINDLPGLQWNKLTADSFLSSPEFASIWILFGGTPVFLVMEEGRVIHGGMAGVIFGPRYLRRFKSMPDSLYGGPFFSSGLDDSTKHQFFHGFYNYLRSGKFIRVDIHNPPEGLHLEWLEQHIPSTHIIELSGQRYSPPDAKLVSDLRRGQKENLQILPFNNEGYLDDFYRLVLETCRRHRKKPRYSKKFFRQLLQIALNDRRVIWPMVMHDGKIIASHIRFIERSQILCWQSYWDKNYRHVNPNHILLDYVIKYALENQIGEINLGGSPPEAESLIRFKEAWGGKRKEILHYYNTFDLGKIIYGWGIR